MSRPGLLSIQKWALLLECTAALLLAWAGLKAVRLPTLSARGCRLFALLRAPALSSRRAGAAGGSEISPTRALQAAAAVRRASRLLPRVLPRVLPPMHCLPQALATQWMLARRGIVSTLHVGVAVGESGFRSHAWLSCQGRVVIGGTDAPRLYREITHAATPPLPSAQPTRR